MRGRQRSREGGREEGERERARRREKEKGSREERERERERRGRQGQMPRSFLMFMRTVPLKLHQTVPIGHAAAKQKRFYNNVRSIISQSDQTGKQFLLTE